MSYFLYAEDDTEDIDILQDVMKVHFQHVDLVSVRGGFELLQHLERVPRNASYPILIILDWILPRVDGKDTLKLLKCDDLFRLIPVAILTTSMTQPEIDYCRDLGADVYIKPSTPAEWSPILAMLREYTEEV